MAYNSFLWLVKVRFFILAFMSPIIFLSCGGFKASQHPDDFFKGGRKISSLDELDAFVSSGNRNPQYRKAEVTTVSGPLRLKTEPHGGAPSPVGMSHSLSKGEEILVYWPLDIENNHIKIFHKQRDLWVTYQSSREQEYVTLLEDLSIPSVFSPGSFTFVKPGGLGLSQSPTQATSLGSDISDFGIHSILLSSAATREAHLAIEAVELIPVDVPTCDFDPLVGNNNSSSNCYEEIVISREFRDFIAKHGYACAKEASRSAFEQSPEKILFHSSAAGQVRRNRTVSGSSKKSVHATGQAIDLFGVSLYFDRNNPRKILMHKDHTDGSSLEERENHNFYWAYVDCWRERIKQYAPCNCSTQLNGAITYQQNTAHHNHVHMSLPLCERSRFNVSCV